VTHPSRAHVDQHPRTASTHVHGGKIAETFTGVVVLTAPAWQAQHAVSPADVQRGVAGPPIDQSPLPRRQLYDWDKTTGIARLGSRRDSRTQSHLTGLAHDPCEQVAYDRPSTRRPAHGSLKSRAAEDLKRRRVRRPEGDCWWRLGQHQGVSRKRCSAADEGLKVSALQMRFIQPILQASRTSLKVQEGDDSRRHLGRSSARRRNDRRRKPSLRALAMMLARTPRRRDCWTERRASRSSRARCPGLRAKLAE